MTTTARLAFAVSATGPDLGLQVILDGHIIWDGSPGTEMETVIHDFDDRVEQQHVLEFHMRGKLPEHTIIDGTGMIVADRCINIADLSFDEIKLGHMFTEVAQYFHDHNGTTDPVTESFYGVMGCNGRVEMRFSTPIYLWLLENM